MKKLRFIGLLAAVVLLAFGLAVACSSGTTSEADEPVPVSYKGTASGGKAVVVTFSDSVDAAKARAVLPANNSDYTITVDTVLASEGKAAVDSAGNITFRDKNGTTEFNGKISGATITVSGIPNPAGGTLSIGGTSSSGGGGSGGGFGSGGGGGGGGGGGEPTEPPAVTTGTSDPADAAKTATGVNPDVNGNLIFTGLVGGNTVTVAETAAIAVPVVIGGAPNTLTDLSSDTIDEEIVLDIAPGAEYTITKTKEDGSTDPNVKVTLEESTNLVVTGGGTLVIDAPIVFTKHAGDYMDDELKDKDGSPFGSSSQGVVEPDFFTGNIDVNAGILKITKNASPLNLPKGSSINVAQGATLILEGPGLYVGFEGMNSRDKAPEAKGLMRDGGITVSAGTLILNGVQLDVGNSTEVVIESGGTLTINNGLIQIFNSDSWSDSTIPGEAGFNTTQVADGTADWGYPTLAIMGGSTLNLAPNAGDNATIWIHGYPFGADMVFAQVTGLVSYPQLYVKNSTVNIGGQGLGKIIVGHTGQVGRLYLDTSAKVNIGSAGAVTAAKRGWLGFVAGGAINRNLAVDIGQAPAATTGGTDLALPAGVTGVTRNAGGVIKSAAAVNAGGWDAD